MKRLMTVVLTALAGTAAADARLGSADFAGQVHASTLLPLESNDVLVAWFQGSREGRDDVTIWGAARRDGTWETPRQIVQVREEPHWNPVLRRGADGRICLYFKVGRKISDWQTYLAESRDEGRTWSAPRELVAGDVTGGRGPVKNKCLRLKGGRLLAPASRENGPWRAFVDISDDDGRTWRPSREMPGKAGVIQPTLWQGADGAVHALLRSDTGFICRSDSTDGGETWSELVRTKLPNNNSGIDLVAASDGRLYLAMNPISGNWASRDTLDLLVSDDGGANWRNFRRLVGPDEKAEYSYPAVVELRSGVLGVTYTWRRRQIAFAEIDLSAARGAVERLPTNAPQGELRDLKVGLWAEKRNLKFTMQDCPSCIEALKMAGRTLPKGVMPIHHSDRGNTYACHAYRAMLDALGWRQSMTEVLHCYDWMVGAKDLGKKNARILGKRVDIGCYEFMPLGLMLLLR